MKRRLLIIAVFLLLGAVVNVAVAWGLAAWAPITGQTSYWAPTPGQTSSDAPRTHGRHLVSWFGVGTNGLTHRVFSLAEWTERTIEFSFTGRAGLPTRCLRGRYRDHVEQGKWTTDHAEVWPLCASFGVPHPQRSFAPPWRRTGLGFVPLRPIWPGFAVNTIFYAAILWPLICGPVALRRFLRVRRGLCPKCAYPMGESSVCTECGGALAKRAVA